MQDTEKIKIEQEPGMAGQQESTQEEECCGQGCCETLTFEEKSNNFQEIEKKIEKLTQELQECKQAQENWKDKCVRISADFENFKKRLAKEQSQWAESAQIQVLKDLLPIIDDFDRAYQEIQKKEHSADLVTLVSGITLIRTAFDKLLQKFGVTEITNYTEFDPLYHEAVTQIESPEHKQGQIVQVFQKGYQYKDIVLRPARVSVAK